MKGAVETVIETIQLGVSVARIELLDEIQIEAVNRNSKTTLPVTPTLFFEFHGMSERYVTEQAEFVQSLAHERGGHSFEWATRWEDREKLWQARHAAYYASLALRPGCQGFISDVCVPISALAECILETQKDHVGLPFPATILGHVGDGNFHVIYVVDTRNEREMERAREIAERVVTRALTMGGTCTGEHGVGYGKIKYLEAEHGQALRVMCAVKQALDPDNRMNPGKIVEPRMLYS